MDTPPFQSSRVAEVFDGYPAPERSHLMALRCLIFDQAARLPQVGRLEETLKWGQPAYLTPETKSGTTIRLHTPKTGGVALLVHCQTTLIADFQATAGQGLSFDGNRAVLLDLAQPIPEQALSILVANALTYHVKP